MISSSSTLDYRTTEAFSGLVLDYLEQDPRINGFYRHPLSTDGFRQAIQERMDYPLDRMQLIEAFKSSFGNRSMSEAQKVHLDRLSHHTTFTVTTAHQPNLFTGYLYVVYKSLHAVRLAAWLSEAFPDFHFVPVFYIGSEDNDLDELGRIVLNGETINWQTKQEGAVGRMVVDQHLVAILDRIAGELGVLPYGQELVTLLRKAYQPGLSIAEASFHLLNGLFGRFGLLILQPDNAKLKARARPLFVDDLVAHHPARLVRATSKELELHYKVQVNPRDINLFYLSEGLRGRITTQNGHYRVEGLDKAWTQEEILQELEMHPERFSPNVVLRSMYQAMILPDVAFVGGGSELAYWMEYKSFFNFYKVPFPVLVLRNSFMLIEKREQKLIELLGLHDEDLFQTTEQLIEQVVRVAAGDRVLLDAEMEEIKALYDQLKQKVQLTDSTLAQHTETLASRAWKGIVELQKKLTRAEKRKYSDRRRQLESLRSKLFPGGHLQERIDNFMPYYARYGAEMMDTILKHSEPLSREFCIVRLTPDV